MPLPPWSRPAWLHVQPGGACPPGWDVDWPHVCMAEASPLDMAWKGGSCSQSPPIFSPVYFNKMNLTKERDSHWLCPDSGLLPNAVLVNVLLSPYCSICQLAHSISSSWHDITKGRVVYSWEPLPGTPAL